MDYKEKYEQALERAKYYHDRDNIQFLENIFPELKESEDSEDEKIRKYLIDVVNDYCKGSEHDGCIAWLEKQGEMSNICPKYVKDSEQKPAKTPQWMIDFLDEHRRHFGNPMDYDERRDVDGKLLCIKEWLEGNYVEQKPAWSEEDEKTINNICHIIRQYDKISKKENQPCWYIGDCLLWMQNIKNNVVPQPRLELSEEDKRIIGNLISQLGNLFARKLIKEETKDKYVNWLKSLRPQLKWKPSEEQIEALDFAVDCIVPDEFCFKRKELRGLLEQLMEQREE